MSTRPRLLVTGHRPDGRSVVEVDRRDEPIVVAAYPGSEFYVLWGTPDGGATVGPGADPPITAPFFAGPGGTRVLFARYQPDSSTPQPIGDPAALAAEVDERLPGLREVFEPDGGGMHTTDTLDYGICLEGELHLELDDGVEVVVTPGTCIVQRGTRHTWHNRGDAPALMCFVGIGARRA